MSFGNLEHVQLDFGGPHQLQLGAKMAHVSRGATF